MSFFNLLAEKANKESSIKQKLTQLKEKLSNVQSRVYILTDEIKAAEKAISGN